MKLTIVIKKGRSGFLIGQFKEFPDVFTQGKTVDEVKENILDALDMFLEETREKFDPDDGDYLQELELNFKFFHS